ncbi:predicted protein [Histoplasma mississippiense (nom. inval.)]|uniref:predicted protein n=1 Tax=Ajellomyces capsulatus (strain NAm1 / WU24) TaxID=2059318 RepID=UPI000157B3C3|nr:predicted protein [Histoplasma mississippiense (nom. inval.)]EDN03206.1 predicted protein [Histoplasma mississippiense (nom. inval.)]
MSGLPSFEGGHLMLQDTAQHHSDAPMVYSNPTHCGMASNAMFQRYVPQYNGGFHYPAVPTMRQEHHSIIMQQRQRQVNCSGLQDLEQNTGAHPFGLDNNAENQSVENNNMQRPATNNKTPRVPLRSSRSHATVSQVDQARSQPFGVRKQSRRRVGGTDTKFEYSVCVFKSNPACVSLTKLTSVSRYIRNYGNMVVISVAIGLRDRTLCEGIAKMDAEDGIVKLSVRPKACQQCPSKPRHINLHPSHIPTKRVHTLRLRTRKN